jgi:hypothetical protein
LGLKTTDIKHKSKKKLLFTALKLLWFGFKLIIILLFCWIIYNEFVIENRFIDLKNTLDRYSTVQVISGFSMLLIMTSFNQIIEALKWKELRKTKENLSVAQALKVVFAGNLLAFVTPARIGEYGGRAFFSNSEHRISALFDNYIASFSQNAWNFIFGAVASFVYLKNTTILSDYPTQLFSLAALGGGILMAATVLNTKKIFLALPKNWVHKFSGFYNLDFEQPAKKTIHYVLFLSMIRYLIYWAQYTGLLFAFGVHENVVLISSAVSMIYLIQSGMPLPSLISGMARVEIAIFLFLPYTDEIGLVLTSSVILWLVNHFMPSFSGLPFLLVKPGICIRKSLPRRREGITS